jgi:hypothetical protein
VEIALRRQLLALLVLSGAFHTGWAQDNPGDDQSLQSTAVEPVSEEALEDTLLGWEADVPDPNEYDPDDFDGDINWVDDSHAYVTNQAQALTEWMDDFFGDPEYNLEQAESQLRLELIDDWETEDGHDFKIRLRGKVQLPKISKRLNLIFSGEESELDDEEDRRVNDEVALQLNVRERRRSRVDLTMGFSSGHLRPGVKYRNEGPIDDRHSYRFIERVQYSDKEKFFSITQLDLNRIVDEDSVLRWSNRGIWGERTNGVEWRTRLALRQRINPDARRPIAVTYFGAITGETRPEKFEKNYRVGFLWRRQVYRDFLFLELEPAYNYRRKEFEDERKSVWSMVVRLEIALQRDLVRKRTPRPQPEASAGF